MDGHETKGDTKATNKEEKRPSRDYERFQGSSDQKKIKEGKEGGEQSKPDGLFKKLYNKVSEGIGNEGSDVKEVSNKLRKQSKMEKTPNTWGKKSIQTLMEEARQQAPDEAVPLIDKTNNIR